jgi:hypothetical protein
MAGILLQVNDGKESVVQYASQSFTKTEVRYSAYEKECLALVWAVETFHHHLKVGSFIIKTDCKSLAWMNTKQHSSRIADWVGWLNQFDYKIEYRPGKLSQNVDGMTRQPIDGDLPISFGKLRQTTEASSDDANIETIAALKRHITNKQTKRDMTARIVAVLTRHARSKQEQESKEPLATSKDASMLKEDFKEQSEEVKEQTKEAITEEQQDTAQMDTSEDLEEQQADPKSSKEGGEAEIPETAFFDCPEDKEGWDRQTWIEEQNRKEGHNKEITAILEKMQGKEQGD